MIGDNRKFQAHRRFQKIGLIVGFVSLLFALLVAHNSPANGYEISIYAATPFVFWLGVTIPIIMSIFTLGYSRSPYVVGSAIFLCATSVFSIVALPLIRGYYFYGLADSLTHLGWTRSIAVGQMSPFELIYPGNHLIAVVLNQVSGVELNTAMMLGVLIMMLLYFIFVPLTVYTIANKRAALVIGAYSGLLLFFVNQISIHLMFHTFTLATMFFPFYLYLVLKHITGQANDRALPSHWSSISLILPLISVTFVLLHPQVALNMFVLLAAFVVVKRGYDRYRPESSISGSRAVYGQATLLGLFFIIWAGQHHATYNMLGVLMSSIVNTVFGAGETGAIVQQRVDSADEIGVSFIELFLKLFFIAAIYTVLTIGLVLVEFFGFNKSAYSSRNVTVSYFFYGGFVLVPFFLLHYLGHASIYFFRHIGFSMVIAAILGSIAIYQIISGMSGKFMKVSRPVIIGVAVMLLLFSLLTVFPSPFVYLPNHHVSEQTAEGYRTAFSHTPDAHWSDDDSVWYTSIRYGPERFDEAIWGYDIHYRRDIESADMRSGLPSHFASMDWETARRDHYLPITSADRKREIVAYREVRYSEKTFSELHGRSGIHRVTSNGDFSLYYVDVSFANTST